MRPYTGFFAFVAAVAVAASCATEPVVTTITVSRGSVSFDAIGDTAQLSASLVDQDGRPIVDRQPTWTSDDQSVATVSSSGLVTAAGNGSTQITASAGGVSDAAAVTVAQVADTVQVIQGNGQTGEVGAALDSALVVQVNDRLDQPIASTSVSFAVTAGGVSVANAAVTTGADGRASTTWTLGTVAGAAQTATASVGGKSATFSATATAAAADSLVEVSGNNQQGAAGAALADSLVVRVADRFGNAVAGHGVSFGVTSGGGTINPSSVSTDSSGRAAARWTLGSAAGTQTAEATAQGVTSGSPMVFTAEAVIGTVSADAGDGQTGLVGFAVNISPSVKVEDSGGSPLQSVTVTFAVAGGGGSITDSVKVTDANGIARVGTWTLGGTPGTNTLTATVSGEGFVGNPVTFTATGVTSSFAIDVRFLTTPTASQQAAFDSAEIRWERLLIGDLVDIVMSVPDSLCGIDTLALNETVDDLVIFATLESIDGPGGVLGQAGPCFVRTTGSLPIVGLMRFDTADLSTLEANGQLELVILHEMGHVLGFGSVWNLLGFLKNPSLPSDSGIDTYFDGPRAIAAFDDLGGTSYTGGNKVPVENELGGQGTRDAHWRESVFAAELMTGFLDVGTNPLSRMSVASMWDLGYTVNLAGADSYTQVFTAPAAMRPGGLHLKDDVIRGPIYVVDATGRVVRVIEW
jgi:hypothetical protein